MNHIHTFETKLKELQDRLTERTEECLRLQIEVDALRDALDQIKTVSSHVMNNSLSMGQINGCVMEIEMICRGARKEAE